MMGGEGLEDASFDGEHAWLGPMPLPPREGGENGKNMPKTRKSVRLLSDRARKKTMPTDFLRRFVMVSGCHRRVPTLTFWENAKIREIVSPTPPLANSKTA